MELVFLTFVFVLAIFLGFELINKVPSTLHTPLMSGSNAISGITLVGALASAGADQQVVSTVLGTLAVAFATINVVGGYLVTDRMLAMFKKKDSTVSFLRTFVKIVVRNFRGVVLGFFTRESFATTARSLLFYMKEHNIEIQ